MSINNIIPTKTISENENVCNIKPVIVNSMIPVSKGFNYKKLCIMIFVTLFLIFLMISAVISIIGIVFIYHTMNEPIPIISPTISPTIIVYNHSYNISSYPSHVPTYMPSHVPTYMPTYMPSISPSQSPTFSPSISPSVVPTANPSQVPTFSPSVSPTTYPSQMPTYFPSISPSVSPTTLPSQVPTFSPSDTPTTYPSQYPTYSLTRNNVHTLSPTPLLTNYTSDNVSLTPSFVPTCLATFIVIYNISVNNNTKHKYPIHNTTVYESSQFKFVIELFTIICPICLCCVCIHVPLAFVPVCLANKKDKMDRMDKDSRNYNSSIKRQIDKIQELSQIKRKHKI